MNSSHKAKMKNALIVGERVFLRPLAGRDLEEFISLNRASARLHRGLVSPPTQPDQFKAFLKRCRRADCLCLLVCRIDDGVILGWISLSQIFRGGFQNAYLGYYVGEGHSGQGHMTEAIHLMLRYAFEDLKLHRLEANIQPGNERSKRLVEHARFRCEGYSPRYLKIGGRWRDHERWAITREDWASG